MTERSGEVQTAAGLNEGRRPAFCTEHDDLAWVYEDGSVGCYYCAIVETGCECTERAEAAPSAGLPDGLDVTRLRKALVNLDSILNGERPMADQIAAEYARLRDSEASPIPLPLPGRSCRHGIVHDQCPYCDSPGADKEEATRRAIQRASEASDPQRLDR